MGSCQFPCKKRIQSQTDGMATLSPSCLQDREALAIPRRARWNPMGLMAVRSYVRDQLSALGELEKHHFASGIDEGINFILKLPGRNPNRRPLLVGAHYDGPLHSIGADLVDRLKVAILELARRWSANPPKRPVWLVAFDQEEWGMLDSAALAEKLKETRPALKLMVSLEMLAFTEEKQSYPHPAIRKLYGERGEFISFVADTSAGLMLTQLTHAIGQHVTTKALPVPRAGRDVPDVRLSDHSPFWDRGYNALMVTDTSFLRNPNYHQISDTIDTLNLPFYASVIDGIKSAIDGL